LPGQVLRQGRGFTGGQIRRGVLGLEVAPALEGAAGLRRGGDQRIGEVDFAAFARAVREGLNANDGLPDQDLALEDPIERAALQDFVRPLRRLPRVDDRRPALRGPPGAPDAQVLGRGGADAELDQVERRYGLASTRASSTPSLT
jgi:hypothetical protein